MSLIERSVEYLKQYIAKNLNVDKEYDIEVDRWLDDQLCKHKMTSFPLETASDLVEAMNYVNEHNHHYNIFEPTETVESIKHSFLRQVIIEYHLLE